MNGQRTDGAGASRRDFLKVLGSVAPAIVPSSVFGAAAPSNRVNLAAFGVGGRGTADTSGINAHPDARFLAVCDCYESRREAKRRQWNKLYGGDYVKAYSNPWEVLQRADIDAVVIATPDHWHTPLAIAAIRAGKDVYVEKPLSVAMKWSWRLRDEMQGKGRILQYGTQQRSSKDFRYACELVRNGYIGKVQRIDAWCPDISQQYGEFGGQSTFSVYRYGSLRPVPAPADLDYDLWCGPSPLRPYTVDRCTSYGAYHIYDYALGFIVGWGAHPLDIAQWGLNADHTSPVYYEGAGSLPEYGLCDTVESWDIHCYYATGVHMRFMDWRVAKPAVMAYRKRWCDHGTTFFGTEGWVSVDREGLETSKESLRSVQFGASDSRLYVSDHHQKNFIDCVKSRKEPISPLEAAIRSDTISHLSDIMVRLKRPVEWDPQREVIVGDEEASRKLDRPMRKQWAI
jgi:predicted dehydrogenase